MATKESWVIIRSKALKEGNDDKYLGKLGEWTPDPAFARKFKTSEAAKKCKDIDYYRGGFGVTPLSEAKKFSKRSVSRIYTQKGYTHIGELMAADGEGDMAPDGPFLGDLYIRDGMAKDELVRKLRDALEKLESHEGNVFVIQ